MKPRRALYLAGILITLTSVYSVYTAHFKGGSFDVDAEEASLQRNRAAGRFVYGLDNNDKPNNDDSDKAADDAAKEAAEDLTLPPAIELHPNGVRSRVREEYDADEPPVRRPSPNDEADSDYEGVDDYEETEYEDRNGGWVPEQDDGWGAEYYDDPAADRDANGAYGSDMDGNEVGSRARQDLIEQQSKHLQQLRDNMQNAQQRQPMRKQMPPFLPETDRHIKQERRPGLQEQAQRQQNFAPRNKLLAEDVPRLENQARAENFGVAHQPPKTFGRANAQRGRSMERKPQQQADANEQGRWNHAAFKNPSLNTHFLEDVESFNGEIQGRFKGTIIRQDDQPGPLQQPAPIQLALNGIQQRFKLRKGNIDNDNEGAVEVQNGPAVEHRAMPAPDFDPEPEVEHEAQERQPDTDAEEAGGQAAIASQHQAFPASDGATFNDRKDDREDGTQDDRDQIAEHINPIAAHGDENSLKTPAVTETSRLQIIPSAVTTNSRFHIIQRVVRTELVARHENDDAADPEERNLSENEAGVRRAAFGVKLSNEVAKVVEKSRDVLLEDRFLKIKSDIERIGPGEEPEVKMGKFGDGRDKDEGTRGGEGNPPAYNLGAPVPARGSFPSRVTLFDLDRPPEGRFVCSPLRLRALSRVVCLNPAEGSTEPSQLIAKGTWEEEELDQFLAALESIGRDAGAVDIGAGKGVFSLAAASKNFPVVAVEPLQSNINTFHKTMQMNQVTDRVTLVTDALGPAEGTGRIRPVAGILGAAFVEPLPLNNMRPAGTDGVVRMVKLDDLVPLVTSKIARVVMKLDVQGDEYKVIQGARRFFAMLDVLFLVMRWTPSQNKAESKEMETFLRQYGLEPARSSQGGGVYSDQDLSRDQKFIVWTKGGRRGG